MRPCAMPLGREYVRWLKEQAVRRTEIRAAYKRERSLTLVGRLYGISRARVHQIVNSKG